MPIQKLVIRPGINRDITNYAAGGGWWDLEKVRFRSGSPEKIGGWVKLSSETFTGLATSLFNWSTLTGISYTGVGTNVKLYLNYGTQYFDITPIRESSTINNNPFAITSGSNTITVTDTSHGALLGDYVTFSGSAAVGNVAAATLNAEFAIQLIVDVDTYTIVFTGTAASSTTSGGGVAVVAAYQVHVGLSTAVPGTGWGAGGYGRGTWNSASSIYSTYTQLRIWSQAKFGEDLLTCDRFGQVYFWDVTGGTAARSVLLTAVSGASSTPTVASGVFVTEDRHVVVWGCNPEGSSTANPMLLRWADTESITAWASTAVNTAGSQQLVNGNSILAARNMKQETLIWTDTALYSMQFIGPPYVFGFVPVETNISLAGPYAYSSAGGVAYWMGHKKFYKYDGAVTTLECPLLNYIFTDFNADQWYQVTCGTIEKFNEIIWFYCSASATNPDAYVIYNYKENLWYFGNMARTAWLDAPLIGAPIAANSDYKLYVHETGLDDGTTDPVSGISAYIESADMDMQDGEHFSFITRIIPDVSFTGSTASAPSVTMKIEMRDEPGEAFGQNNSGSVTSALATLDQYTQQVYVRLRGRQLAYRISSSGVGVQWELGNPRLDIRPDGMR